MSCPAGAAAPRPAGGVGPFGLRVNRWNQSVDVWRNPYSALTNDWCAFIRIEAVRRFLPDLGWQWTWADLNAGLRGFVHTGLPANTPATSTLRTSLVP